MANFWEGLARNLRAKKGHFNGTEDTAAIQKRMDSGKAFDISNPTSYRTYQNVGEGSLDPNDIETGLTSGTAGAISSTAIKNVRYDPSDDSLNITYNGGDKEYKFKAGGEEGLKEWINADSKGKITQEWRKTHRYPGY